MKRVFLVVALLLCAFGAQAQDTLSFTMTTTVNGANQVEPRLSWSTSPPAVSCAATGDWSGTKGPSGDEQQAGTLVSKSYTLQCSWPGDSIVSFTWTPATMNENNTAYTDPQLVRIKYTFGATAPTPTTPCGGAVVCVDVPDPFAARPTMKTVTGITNIGTLRAIAQHINSQNAASAPSNVATKVFTGNVGVTQNVVLNFPGTPQDFGAN